MTGERMFGGRARPRFPGDEHFDRIRLTMSRNRPGRACGSKAKRREVMVAGYPLRPEDRNSTEASSTISDLMRDTRAARRELAAFSLGGGVAVARRRNPLRLRPPGSRRPPVR